RVPRSLDTNLTGETMMSRQRAATAAALLAVSAMATAVGSAVDGQTLVSSSQPSVHVAARPAREIASPPAAPSSRARARAGYYRFPAIHGDVVVFTAEGDLWRTTLAGGVATRLTTHASEELRPAISPDGQWLAYSASYEGPRDVYVMPITGGPPVRQSWDGDADVVGWTADGRVLYATQRYSTLPNTQVVAVRPCLSGSAGVLDARAPSAPCSPSRSVLPLAQAADGV